MVMHNSGVKSLSVEILRVTPMSMTGLESVPINATIQRPAAVVDVDNGRQVVVKV